MTSINDILSFWFDAPDGTTNQRRKVWFQKDPAFDAEIQARFGDTYCKAAAGELDDWQHTADGALALILVLDQFARNLFRGQPQSFALDNKALAIAQHAIAQGFDQQLPPIRRYFVYMPFMHSESVAIQRQSVELFTPLRDDPQTESAYPYAVRHYEIIEQFGRFPHRNAILGRKTTPTEAEFLQQPGSSF